MVPRPASTALLALVVGMASGCTVDQLRTSTANQARTVTEFHYEQILNNVAFLINDPYALPSHLSVKTGSTQISDSGSAAVAFDLRRFSGTVPNVSGSRTIVDQWGTAPVTDTAALKLMRIAYQRALGMDSHLSLEVANEVGHALTDQIGTNADISMLGEALRFSLEDMIWSRVAERGSRPEPLPPSEPEERADRAIREFKKVADLVYRNYVTTLQKDMMVEEPVGSGHYHLNRRAPKPSLSAGGAVATGLALETERRLEDLQSMIERVPRGWFHVGRKRDVPRNARYKGHCGDTWVWVCPDGTAGLAEFTLGVLEIAAAFKETQLLTIPTGVQFSPALSGGTR